MREVRGSDQSPDVRDQIPAGKNEYSRRSQIEYFGSRPARGYLRDKILKGSKPADLPVEQRRKFELFINLKAAKQIGLTIPESMLYRADLVIK